MQLKSSLQSAKKAQLYSKWKRVHKGQTEIALMAVCNAVYNWHLIEMLEKRHSWVIPVSRVKPVDEEANTLEMNKEDMIWRLLTSGSQ